MHDDKPMRRLSRRQALAGVGVLAAPAILGRAARAADGKVVLGTWGGDYARLLNENVEQPFLARQGIEIITDVADDSVRLAKIQAQRRLPRGAFDIACVQSVVAYQLAEIGLVEELTPEKVPNIVHMNPKLATPTYAPHIYSPQVIAYNPDRVPEPPTTLTELLDPKFNGKIGFPNGNFFYAMMASSLATSGGPSDMDRAKALMVKLNDNGLRLYPSTDAAGPPYKTGELDAGLMWLARVNMWQNAGIPVKASFPKEGCILYVSGMVVPRNAPNKEGAFKYINAMLEPDAQRGFAKNMGYLPTVQNAPLSGTVAEQLALPDGLKMVVPDYAYTTRVSPETSDWWKKTIEHS